MFELAKQQMSQQPHYDWGLRAVKAVLNSAGSIFQAKKKEQTEEIGRDKILEIEQQAIIGAVIDAVIPKLIQSDVMAFYALLANIFPGVSLEPVENLEYKECVLKSIKSMGLIPTELFVQKIMQIYRCSSSNIGLMLVGETGTGKSAALSVFMDATEQYQALLLSRADDAAKQQF